MIRYALVCVGDHEFEAWFSNSAAYDAQRKKKLVECPVCSSADVRKQIMAPAIRVSGQKSGRLSGRQSDVASTGAPALSPEMQAAAEAARMAGEIRKHIASTHDYVGEKFADEARAMYYGEAEHRPVWGEVTPDVARELHEEGVPATPLPKPFAPDPPRRRNRMN